MSEPAARSWVEPATIEPVVEAQKKDVDRTLLRANLARTVEERVQNLGRLRRFVQEFRHRPPKRHGRWTMRKPRIAAHGWAI